MKIKFGFLTPPLTNNFLGDIKQYSEIKEKFELLSDSIRKKLAVKLLDFEFMPQIGMEVEIQSFAEYGFTDEEADYLGDVIYHISSIVVYSDYTFLILNKKYP